MDTLVEILSGAADRFGDRTALGIHQDDGTELRWSFRELDRRSRHAAWRLRALSLQPGDRLLTWAPSAPALPAVYFGAMRAGVIFVPLDLRMSADAIERIADRAEATRLALGTGRDAPDPRDAGLERFPTTTVDALTAEPDETFPSDWEAVMDGWQRPARDDVFELVSISAIHRVIPPIEHRIVSLLPLSHLLEQAVGLFYALDVGADILYVRSRSPRVIFEAIRHHRTTTMVLVPQVLDLFWSAIEREVAKAGRAESFNCLRSIARRLPYGARRWLFRRVHQQFGGGLRLLVSTAAFLPPVLQQAWEDLGVFFFHDSASTECGFGACTTREDHGLGTVGRALPPVELRLADDGEILIHGPNVFGGYWRDPEATAAAFTPDGWYKTGDIGRFDDAGRLILMGRTKDIIVLPNGFNIYPEDVENALRVAGMRDSVVLETRPGRIEAIVLTPGAYGLPAGGDTARGPSGMHDDPAAVREAIAEAVRKANQTLAPHQRVEGWRLWPEADFPRTHTLKVKRDQVRAWAVIEENMPVRQGA